MSVPSETEIPSVVPTIPNIFRMINRLSSIHFGTDVDLKVVREAVAMLAYLAGDRGAMERELEKERRDHGQRIMEYDNLLVWVRRIVIEDDPGDYVNDEHERAWTNVKLCLATHGYGEF